MQLCTAINFDGSCTISGRTYPAIGFGTYPLEGHDCTAAVSEALQQGYRIIDTATYYENFEAVAVATQGWKRDNIYLISKVWHNSHTREGIEADLKRTLERLNTSYLDGYLLHWPNSKVPIEETLSAMGDLRQKGKIRDIGLSNVTVNHLKRALEVGIPITWVQVEMHAQYCDDALLGFCREKSIVVQAWRPLNLGKLCDDSMLSAVGDRYGKSAAQIALRWIIQKGALPIPGSANPEHIVENLDVFDFSLTNEEMERISKRANVGQRLRLKLEDGLGFEDEFDFSYGQCWPKSDYLQSYYEKFSLLAKEEKWKEILDKGEVALRVATNINSSQDIAKISAQLTSTAFYLGDYALALSHANRCLELSEKCENASLLVRALYLKSAMHRATAAKETEEALQQQFFQSAVESAEEGFRLYSTREMHCESLLGKVYFNWGAAYADYPKGNWEAAEKLYVEALNCFKSIDADCDIVRTNIRLGKVYLLNKKYDLCRKILDESRIRIVDERNAMHADYLEAQLEFALNHLEGVFEIANRGLLRSQNLGAKEDEYRFNGLIKLAHETFDNIS